MFYYKVGVNTRRILTRIQKVESYFLARKFRKSLKKTNLKETDYEWHILDKGINENNYIYLDEYSNQVKSLGALGLFEWLGYPKIELDDSPKVTNRVVYNNNGNITIQSEEKSEFRWVVLKYFKPLGDIYTIEFTVTIESEFTELQFGINWESITTRDRFMVVNNRTLIYQNVIKALFLPKLVEKPLSLELGKPTHFRIVVIEDNYSVIIDNELKISFSFPLRPALKNGEFAFIFYEKSAKRSIVAHLQDVNILIGTKKAE